MYKKACFYFISLVVFSISLTAMEVVDKKESTDGVVWNFNAIEPAYAPGCFGVKIEINERSEDVQSIVEKMRANPLELLRDCQRCRAQYVSSTEGISEEEATKINQIFMLDECCVPTCKLNRKDDKQICPRAHALEMIEANVYPVLEKREITVANYACGDLFSVLELVISLHRNGYQVKKIILIDPELFPVIMFARHELLGEPMDHAGLVVNIRLMADEAMYAKFLRIKQFLGVVNKLHGNVEILAFNHAFAYAAAVETDSIEADICVAMDYAITHRDFRDYDNDFQALLRTKIGMFCNLVCFRMHQVEESLALHCDLYHRADTGDLDESKLIKQMQ